MEGLPSGDGDLSSREPVEHVVGDDRRTEPEGHQTEPDLPDEDEQSSDRGIRDDGQEGAGGSDRIDEYDEEAQDDEEDRDSTERPRDRVEEGHPTERRGPPS